MMSADREFVAAVGAGIAGATIARSLVLAEHAVHVFDKSRGPGGRLATRRVDWVDQSGHARTTRLDHGAIGITARCAAFQAFVDLALHEGRLAAWKPKQAAGSLPIEGGTMLYLPAPDIPALCRHLLDGTAATWRASVPGQAHWVAHARTGWSRRHLEQPAAWVQEQMQVALDECVGRPVDWHHCAVHRWRYALPQAHGDALAALFWLDAVQGLGVCGGFLGCCGVEGAWLSAQSLSVALLQRATDVADASPRNCRT